MDDRENFLSTRRKKPNKHEEPTEQSKKEKYKSHLRLYDELNDA